MKNYRPKILDAGEQDIKDIEEHLAQYSPTAVRKFFKTMRERIRSLRMLPYSCPAYEEDPFFRRMVMGDYILFYSVDEKRELVIVHRIFHHSRNIDRHMREYRATM